MSMPIDRRTALACAALCLMQGLPGLQRAARASAVGRLSLQDAAARLREGGWVMMMRHAQTEAGIGDPPGYRLDRCETQRNLSPEGRAQARRAGEAIRAAGIAVGAVRSSAWCRCRDTAELAFGAHEVWGALNSFFEDRSREAEQSAQVADFARALQVPANAMLVTHQVNVLAAMGASPAQGEIMAGRWRDGRLRAEFGFLPA